MATVTITIPSPILTSPETFAVTIVNSAGSIVFTGTETNAPFDVPLDPAAGYVMTTDFNGDSSQWCFDVNDCNCPVIASVEFIQTAATPFTPSIYYILVAATYTSGFTNPYTIQVIDSAGVVINYPINSLTDYTFITGGTLYTKKIHVAIGSYTLVILDNCGNVCQKQFLTLYSGICTGPTIQSSVGSGPVGFEIYYPGSPNVPYLKARWLTDTGSCNTITVNYYQNLVIVGAPGSGTVTLTGGTPGTDFSFPVNFNSSYLNPGDPGVPQYHTVVTDCCGNVIFDGNTLP